MRAVRRLPPRASDARDAGGRAARNTFVRATAEIVGKLASLALFAVMARTLGAGEVGVFVFAFALLQIVTMAIDLGLDRWLVREIAAKPEGSGRLIWDVGAAKIALAVPVIGVTLIALAVLGVERAMFLAVAALSVGFILDSLSRVVWSAFTGHERGGLIAVGIIAQRFTAAGIGIGVLAAGQGVFWVGVAYSAGAAVGFLASLPLLVRAIHVPRPALHPETWRSMLGGSLPFGVSDVLTAALFKLDAVLLAALAANVAVGHYGIAYRIFEAPLFLTYSLSGAFAAMYTYLGPHTDPPIRTLFSRSIKLALAVLTPCAVIFAVLGEPIVELIFGSDLRAAAEPLRILAPAIVLLGVANLSASLLVSRGDPRVMMWISGAVLAVNLGLNVVLIPVHQESGAAFAMLVSEGLAALTTLALAVRAVGGFDWLRTTLAPAAAALVMVAVTVPLAEHLPAAIALGMVAYALSLFAVDRIVAPGDVRFVRELLAGRFPSGPSPLRRVARRSMVGALRRLGERTSISIGGHGVGPIPIAHDPLLLVTREDMFRRQLELVLDAGFEVVTLSEFARRSAGGPPPPGMAAFTFDDGMQDNHSVLMPLLAEYEVPATVFVATGLVDQPNPWIDPAAGARMMNESEILDLAAAGIEIGAHTVSHPDLSTLSYADCLAEMHGSREWLERLLGRRVETFAYPFGHHSEAARRAAADAGFLASVTCDATGPWDAHELRRAMIRADDNLLSFALKVLGTYDRVYETAPAVLTRSATRGLRQRLRARRGARELEAVTP